MSPVADVVVVGGGIAGLTAAWEVARTGRRVTLVEASDHLGGLVRPLDVGGVVVNRGPEAFALRRPAVSDLCADLGIATELPTRGSWLVTPEQGAFRSPDRAMLGIPADPTAADVVAAVGHAAARRAAQDADLGPDVGADATDLASFVTARMGEGLLDRLVRPLVSAIHGADPAVLSVDGVMPGLRDALRRTGSLAAAVAAILPQGPAVASVTGGMHRLADQLALAARDAGATLLTRAPVTSLERGEDARWRVTAGRAGIVEAEHVVVATSGPTTLALIAGLADTSAVRTAPGAATTHVTLLLDAPELDDAPRGSGVIAADGVPGAKALTHVTAKWDWAQRAAGPGRHVVRLSYGRPGQDLPSPEPAQAVADAGRLLGTELGPEQLRAVEVVRHKGLLAPAAPGVREAVLTLSETMTGRGVHLAGALVAGTGLPAVVSRSRSLAAAIG